MTHAPGPSPVRVGRYLLCDVIGGGGMGKVHLGRALGAAGFSRMVAIKRLHPARARDPRFSTMLVDEARLVSRIRHPNVVPTLDVLLVEGELLVVMEYVPGVALSQLVALAKLSGAAIPRSIAARLVLDVLAGLGAAHSATSERGRALGIVHRDVSPQNVIAGADGLARVVDFGIAKAEGKLSVTREGEIKGKLAYMAPEQLRGEEVDLRADLYSAGVMLWELVTGQRLITPDGDLATQVAKVLASAVPAASELTDVPPALDALLLRALAADRTARYESAASMAEALESATEIAQPKEVAAFVGKLAGSALQQREDLIAHVEQLSVSYDAGGHDEAARTTQEPAVTEVLPTVTEVLPAPTARLPIATQPLAAPATQPLPRSAATQPLAHAFVAGPAPMPVAASVTPLAPVAPAAPAGPSRTRLAAIVLAIATAGCVVLFVAAGPRACGRRRGGGAIAPTSTDEPGGSEGTGNRKHGRGGRKAREEQARP